MIPTISSAQPTLTRKYQSQKTNNNKNSDVSFTALPQISRSTGCKLFAAAFAGLSLVFGCDTAYEFSSGNHAGAGYIMTGVTLLAIACTALCGYFSTIKE